MKMNVVDMNDIMINGKKKYQSKLIYAHAYMHTFIYINIQVGFIFAYIVKHFSEIILLCQFDPYFNKMDIIY